jgi:hypothetical protein
MQNTTYPKTVESNSIPYTSTPTTFEKRIIEVDGDEFIRYYSPEMGLLRTPTELGLPVRE